MRGGSAGGWRRNSFGSGVGRGRATSRRRAPGVARLIARIRSNVRFAHLRPFTTASVAPPSPQATQGAPDRSISRSIARDRAKRPLFARRVNPRSVTSAVTSRAPGDVEREVRRGDPSGVTWTVAIFSIFAEAGDMRDLARCAARWNFLHAVARPSADIEVGMAAQNGTRLSTAASALQIGADLRCRRRRRVTRSEPTMTRSTEAVLNEMAAGIVRYHGMRHAFSSSKAVRGSPPVARGASRRPRRCRSTPLRAAL